MLKPAALLRTLLLAPVAPLLIGCVTAPREPPAPTIVVSCGKVAPIDKSVMTKAADELDKLPADSVVANIIVPDWLRMRDENRACEARN
jgi:hypothetical protein